MEGIMTTGDLAEVLAAYPLDTPVMIAVVKYPHQMPVFNWRDDSSSECLPLEGDEVTCLDGIVYIAVELTEYNEERRAMGG